MALAVRAGQLGDRAWQVRFLLMTMVLGAAFLGIKGVEYHEEYEKHLVPGLNFSPAAPAPAERRPRHPGAPRRSCSSSSTSS